MSVSKNASLCTCLSYYICSFFTFIICPATRLIHSMNNKGIINTFKIWLLSPKHICSCVILLDRRGGRDEVLVSDFVISAGVLPHQLGVHFSASAVLIRAAGEEQRFHSRKLRNVSARKVESCSVLSSSAAQPHVLLLKDPHTELKLMSSFPVYLFLTHSDLTYIYFLIFCSLICDMIR